MLADLTIIPVGAGAHTSPTLGAVLKAIDESGIAYQLTPSSTCLEGSWDEIMQVVRRCHDIARREHAHVVTQLRLEDDATADAMLRRNLESVEEKAGCTLNKQPATAGTQA